MHKPVYLDYAATTPVDPEVAKLMTNCLTMDGHFGNPASSTHCYGWEAEALVEDARRQVASLFNADPRSIIWTSGATESDNLAIQGVANFYREKGNHLITCLTEHKAVLDTFRFLETKGFEVTYLRPQPNGRIDLAELEAAIKPTTTLISIMQVNNETGVIQDIPAIGRLAKENKIFMHVDAAQSAGKMPIDLETLPVDLMSFSGHKLYGPKGIGALYVKRKPKVRLEALIHGGKHEQGLRSGTLATHQIVGMGKAFALAKEQLGDATRLQNMRSQLIDGLVKLGGVHINGDTTHCIPGIINFSVEGVEGEALLMALQNLAVSTGSACNSSSVEPSHVLTAMGVSSELAHSSVRFSFGRFSSCADIEFALSELSREVTRLRAASPLWQVN